MNNNVNKTNFIEINIYMEDVLQMKNQFKNKRAFTLIELLIVIAIIGILFIVLVSKVDFATDKAKASGVQTDFRSFQMAFDTVAKENAGFNTFGFDMGDNGGGVAANSSITINGKTYTYTNADKDKGDGIRNSYDEGDANLDGKNVGETWTGRKVYTETWTDVWTLVKPGTTGYNADSIFALESAINKNLDPKLHITIASDGKITMANQARDPWKNEYHGYYITNAETDKGDRGAIVMYSNGANGKWGSAHDITNGVVTVTVPGNNVNGKDDYSIVSCYTFTNGYGEVLNMSTGFSNNQSFNGAGISNAPSVVPGENGGNGEDDNNEQIDLKCGDVVIDGSFMYTYKGAATLEEFRAGMKPYYENMIGLSWDEILAYAGGDEEVAWEMLGVTANNFTPQEPGWRVSLASNTATGGAIKDSVNGVAVTSIDEGAFAGRTSLTHVILPNSITYIGREAFDKCTNLQSINIPDGVTELGDEAFRYCSSLTNIEIPNSVTAIGENCFSNCDLLTTVTIGTGIGWLNRGLLTGCDNLETIIYRGTTDQWYDVSEPVEGMQIMKDGVQVICSDGIAKDVCHLEMSAPAGVDLTITYQMYHNGNLETRTIGTSAESYGWATFQVACGTEIFINYNSDNFTLTRDLFTEIDCTYRFADGGVYVVVPNEQIIFFEFN